MEPILKSILENKTENYLLPFFWQHDGHDAEIPARVQKIYESGCRAFCVESRPYEHFCEDAWWKTMDIILAEAKKRGMRVWVLDDKHFPTGYANGILEHEDLNLASKTPAGIACGRDGAHGGSVRLGANARAGGKARFRRAVPPHGQR